MATAIRGNPWVVGVVAMAILAVAAIRILGMMGPPDVTRAWYYDLGTGELYAAAADAVPPIEAPSGGDGVRAIVVSCDQCSDASQRQIVYLEKWSQEDRAYLMAPDDAGDRAEPAPLVATPGQAVQWVDMESPQGRAIVAAANAVYQQCPETYRRCRP
jgi:hypothetical protein